MDSARIGTAGFQPACRQDGPGFVRRHSRGYVPHIDGADLVQHVVFRLADSLPATTALQVAALHGRDRIVTADAALDRGHGCRHLALPGVAALVQAALLRFDRTRYTIIAWCIMPNHVHVLAQVASGYRLEQIVHAWKSFTANQANRLLPRSGPFWAREYFDRYMRNEEHLARTAAYIEGNPVKAGLCENIEDWRFSSAGRARTADFQLACRQDAGGPDRGA